MKHPRFLRTCILERIQIRLTFIAQALILMSVLGPASVALAQPVEGWTWSYMLHRGPRVVEVPATPPQEPTPVEEERARLTLRALVAADDTAATALAPELAQTLLPVHIHLAKRALEHDRGWRPDATRIARARIAIELGNYESAVVELISKAPPYDAERWCDVAEALVAQDVGFGLEDATRVACDGELAPSPQLTPGWNRWIAEEAFRTTHRNDALRTLERSILALPDDSVAWCETQVFYATTLRRVDRASSARDVYEQVRERCGHAPWAHVRAEYQVLVGAALAYNTGTLREVARRMLANYPHLSHADDVYYWLSQGDSDRARKLSRAAVERFDRGDMVGRMILRAADRMPATEREEFLVEMAMNEWRDPAYQSAGRIELELYRIARDRGDNDGACEWLGELRERYPWSWSAEMAVDAAHDCGFAALSFATDDSSISLWARDPEQGRVLQYLFEQRAYGVAAEMLEAMPVRSFDENWLLVAARLFSGDEHGAYWLTREELYGWEHRVSVDDPRWRWVYPTPWREAVVASSEATSAPASAVYGIMREESAFRDTVASHAGARGLMQVMPTTAVGHLEGVEGTWETERLLDPEVNIRVGANVIAHILNYYPGDIARLATSYNAGRGRTRQWDSRRGGYEPVDWIESIPFSETIHYVRRVVGSERVYRLLYFGGEPTPAQPTDAEAGRPDDADSVEENADE